MVLVACEAWIGHALLVAACVAGGLMDELLAVADGHDHFSDSAGDGERGVGNCHGIRILELSELQKLCCF